MLPCSARPRSSAFPTVSLREMWKKPEGDIRPPCAANTGTVPTYYLVDTCAAEFEAYTPYFYSDL